MKKFRLCTITVALSVIALLFSACTSPASILEDTSWVLKSYGEVGNMNSVLAGTEITVHFNGENRQVRGSAGANTYFGTYQIDSNKITIRELAWTELYRLEPEGVMEQEENYLGIFMAAESFRTENGTLEISSPDGVLLYENTGVLEGTVTIGPIIPVEKPGETTPIPCEVYQARKILVYDESADTLIKQIEIDCEGNYRANLAPGHYTIDINNTGIDHSAEVPMIIVIETGKTVTLDIDIDTGIR